MELIDKIRAEIANRLKANGAFDEVGDSAWEYDQGMIDAYKSILSFLDTLQEPKIISPFTGGKVTLESHEEEITFRGEKIKIDRKIYRCKDTGKEFTDAKLDDDMMWDVFRKYCEKKGFKSFDELLPRDKQQEPEVDLEEEIEKAHQRFPEVSFAKLARIAKRFYELGKNSK